MGLWTSTGVPEGSAKKPLALMVPLIGAIFIAAGMASPTALNAIRGSQKAVPQPPVEASQDAGLAYGNLSPWFEANQGQAGPDTDFVARAGGRSLQLTADGPVFNLRDEAGGQRSVRLGLIDGRRVKPDGIDRLSSTSNYLLGNDPAAWRQSVPHFAKVAYRQIWPGVDLEYRGQGQSLEYDFVVQPGADPASIGMVVAGSDGALLSPEGDLVVTVGGTEIRQSKPVAYQEVNGTRRLVSASFTLDSVNHVNFQIGTYDHARPLVIDPVLSWSTTLGGQGADSVTGIAVDAAGSAYVTGSTASTDFPTVSPALQGTRNGAFGDAFVAKLNPAGTALLWSTYLGGTAADDGAGIAVDAAGNAVIVGSTASTNFPLVNAFQGAKGAGTTNDIFVARFNPTGSALTYSTYLGGSGADTGRGIALGLAGAAHITGSTASTNFPVRKAFQATKGTGTTTDAFVAQIATTATGDPSLVYSTYLGGASDDLAAAIAVDGSGRSYITGETRSANFPTVAPLKPAISGACPTTNDSARLCREAFVAKLDPAATGAASVAWSTYLGGTTSNYHLEIGEGGMGIAVDASGSAYVTGDTASDDFPVVSGFQSTRTGDLDAFVTKLSPGGNAIAYSTYLGGFGQDIGRGIAVDVTGSAFVTGNASASFPRVNPVGAIGSNTDAFVTQLSPTGAAVVQSTHLGGDIGDFGRAVALDPSGAALVGGSSTAANFPTLNPLQAAPGGENDGFVVRIAAGPSSGPLVSGLEPRSGPSSGGTPVVVSGSGFTDATAVRFGTVPATSFRVESASRLVAVSPGGSGQAVVTVQGSLGSSPPNPVGRFAYGEGLWSATGPQTQRRLTPTMTLLANGKVLLAGGRSASNGPAITAAEIYDPLTNTWSTTGSMVVPRYAHTSTLLADGKVLVAGGFTLGPPVFNATGGFVNAGPVTDTAEIYDPVAGTWTAVGAMVTRRTIHTATRLPDGRVLAAGGRTCTGPPPLACDSAFFTNKSELFNPVTRTWSATGDLAFGRHTGDAVLLNDGRVMTAGGFGMAGTPEDPNLNVTEIYTPSAGTWSTVGPLNVGRGRLILVRMLDGKVLAVGGFGAAKSSEVFDPATATWSLSGTLSQDRSGHCAVLLPRGDVLSPLPGSVPTDLYDPASGRWRPGALTTSIHNCFSGVTRADALVLSSSPTRFEADPTVCGRNCGKALLAGDSPDQPFGDLYTPAPVVTGITPTGGSRGGGTRVAISGIGLSEATEVSFGGIPGREVRVDSYSQVTAVAPTSTAGRSAVTVTTPGGRSEPVSFAFAADFGYRLAASDGGVFSFGDLGFLGSTGGTTLNSPVVGMAHTASKNGYWLVAADGGIFAFGDAVFRGSMGGTPLNKPIVGMQATASGNGYWLVASDGGIFAFGDAAFKGSTAAAPLNKPIVAIEASVSGNGYWLVASDGGIFAFGDAAFSGSTGASVLNKPIVGMERSASGNGYWLVAADGGIFAFGDAVFRGSTGASPLAKPIVGIARTPAGQGYWLVASDGGIFAFGDAPFFGSVGGSPLSRPVVGLAA